MLPLTCYIVVIAGTKTEHCIMGLVNSTHAKTLYFLCKNSGLVVVFAFLH